MGRETLSPILQRHAYPDHLGEILGEARILATLVGSGMKFQGRVMTQAEGDGPVSMLVGEYHKDGSVRAYSRFEQERWAYLERVNKGEKPHMPQLFGPMGRLGLIIVQDRPASQPYQGIVPLEGDSLADALEHYFVQSEQIPSLVRVEVAEADGRYLAGGLLLQHLPDGEEGRERLHVRLDHPEWGHVRTLAETVTGQELIDPAIELEALVWRLYHDEEEVRVLPRIAFSKGCRCDDAHIRDVIGKFGAEERAEMADDDGMIRVSCEFCSKAFPIELSEIEA